jgi:predicted GNAT family N-acyltransferase
MIPDDFTVEPIEWSNARDRTACRDVREEVFIVEQGVPHEDEWDAQDAVSRHVLARDLSGVPIGTGRLVPPDATMAAPAHIGRMAVIRKWRAKGVGEAVLHVLVEQARALGYPALEMHAQSHAVQFYLRSGFVAYGDEFLECGIPHFHMRRELAPLATRKPSDIPLPPRPPTRSVAVESREQARVETVALIKTARREVCIYTRDLDPALYDTEPVLDALKRLAISQRGARIRMLVQEPQHAAKRGHRLVTLAQRLPSVFSFRTPTEEEDLQFPSAFLTNDTRGYYFRVLGNRYEGEAVNHASGRNAQLREYFNQAWERSEPSEDLRLLAL